MITKFKGFIKRKHKIGRLRFKGQSIVEFTILLPLLLMLLSGLIEFGFMLNEYLDLIDTTRETARYLSDQNPFEDGTENDYQALFYTGGVDEMAHTIDRAGWINLDNAHDDVVISVFSVTDWADLERFPAPRTEDRGNDELYHGECTGQSQGGEIGWRLYFNEVSKFSKEEILDLINNTSSIPPNNGIVLIEIYYDYHMRLSLPWITAFTGNTIGLHAYSFAPNPYAEP